MLKQTARFLLASSNMVGFLDMSPDDDEMLTSQLEPVIFGLAFFLLYNSVDFFCVTRL